MRWFTCIIFLTIALPGTPLAQAQEALYVPEVPVVNPPVSPPPEDEGPVVTGGLPPAVPTSSATPVSSDSPGNPR